MARRMCLLGMLVVLSVAYASAQGTTGTTTFSISSISGAYGITYSGTVLSASGSTGSTATTSPIAGAGQLVFDGKGGVTGSETFNRAGTVCAGTLTGTDTVNPDGTATITLTLTPTTSTTSGCASGTLTLGAVAVNGGQQVLLSGTDTDKVVSGQASKQ